MLKSVYYDSYYMFSAAEMRKFCRETTIEKNQLLEWLTLL